jgi:heptosyltransferase-2
MEMNAAGIKRVLIRGTNWIGDAVMSVPAMRAIRRCLPESRISLLIRPWVADVYGGADFLDEIISFDKDGLHRGLSGRRRLVSDLRARQFDLAVLFQNAFESALLAWCARIPLRIGYARDGRSLLLSHAVPIDPEVRLTHQAYYYLGVLAGVGLLEPQPWKAGGPLPACHLEVRESDREAARSLLRTHGVEAGETLIGLNPGASYGGAKRWLPDRFAEVADQLAGKYGARIVIFGSGAELPITRRVAETMKSPSVNLAGQTTLGQLMGLIKECALLVTNDSGPMHLAAALSVPQVAIFGSTSDVATGPLSDVARVVRVPAECSPCFLRECPTDFRCMTGITVGMIMEAAEQKLRESRQDCVTGGQY